MNKMKIAIVAILVSVLGFAGGASAQPSWLPSSGLTPGSPFYFMDTAMESIGSFFTFGKENKAERKLELMSERLSEAKQLANKGSKKAAEAVEKYEREFEDITSEFKGLGATTTQQVAEATNKHLSVLEQVSKKVPKEARKGIQTALQNSAKGHRNALGALQRKSPPQFVEAAINSGENRVKDMTEYLSATGTPEKVEQKVEARMRNVKNLMEEVSSSTQADPKAAEMAAEKMDKLIDRLEQVKEKSERASSEVRERIDELQEEVTDQHIQSFKTAFENNSKKAAEIFSKTMKGYGKQLQREAAKARVTGDIGEKLQGDLFRQQKYESLGKEISKTAKGVKTGTTTVGELVEKATQRHQKVLDRVKERVPAPAKEAIERAQQRAESRERIQERREEQKEKTQEMEKEQKEKIQEKMKEQNEQRESEEYEEEGSAGPISQKDLTLRKILKKPEQWVGKTLRFKNLRVDMADKCRHVYRQGEFCATDGTASITVKPVQAVAIRGGGLSKILTRPGQHFGENGILSKEELKNKTFRVKVKVDSVKVEEFNAGSHPDNVIGGTKQCPDDKKCSTLIYLRALSFEWNQGAEPSQTEENPQGKEKCQSMQCLIEASKKCEPATLIYELEASMMGMNMKSKDLLQIKGEENGKCVFYKKEKDRTVEISEKTKQRMLERGMSEKVIKQRAQRAHEMAEKVTGREFRCRFEQEKLTNMLKRWQNGKFSSEDMHNKNCERSLSGER